MYLGLARCSEAEAKAKAPLYVLRTKRAATGVAPSAVAEGLPAWVQLPTDAALEAALVWAAKHARGGR